MLDLTVTIEGDKVVINGLKHLVNQVPDAIKRGLEQNAIGIYTAAQGFLSGSGGTNKKVRTDYTGFTKKSGEEVKFRSYEGAGAYPPVPIRTKGLLDHLYWLKSGESKSGPLGTVTAGPFEVIISDSAEYARVIHEGTGSSAKFGPRRYLTDALEKFNQGDAIKRNLEAEIQKEISKAGLK